MNLAEEAHLKRQRGTTATPHTTQARQSVKTILFFFFLSHSVSRTVARRGDSVVGLVSLLHYRAVSRQGNNRDITITIPVLGHFIHPPQSVSHFPVRPLLFSVVLSSLTRSLTSLSFPLPYFISTSIIKGLYSPLPN